MRTGFLRNCAYCGKPRRIPLYERRRADARNQTNFYCDRECYHAATRNPEALPTNNCIHCGEKTKNLRHCTRCRGETGGVKVKYIPSEIVHLAAINPGYGFKRFVGKLYTNKDGKQASRVLGILLEYNEETSIDLYAMLENPEYRTPMHWADYLEKYGELPMSHYRFRKRRKPPKNKRTTRGKRYTVIEAYPDFNWGDVTER